MNPSGSHPNPNPGQTESAPVAAVTENCGSKAAVSATGSDNNPVACYFASFRFIYLVHNQDNVLRHFSPILRRPIPWLYLISSLVAVTPRIFEDS